MAMYVNDRHPLWVKDTRPDAVTNYVADFDFFPASLVVPEGTVLRIFSGRMTAPANRPFEIRLRYLAGMWSVTGIIRTNDGTSYRTDWFPLLAAWNEIAIQWWSATSSPGDGGGLGLWVNRTFVFGSGGIANDQLVVDGVQLGILGGLRLGSSGSAYVDNFASWTYPDSPAFAGSAAIGSMVGQPLPPDELPRQPTDAGQARPG